jgi:hypothetical protein
MPEMSDGEDRLKQPRAQKLLPFMSAVMAASSLFIAQNSSWWSSFDQRFSWIPAPLMIAGCAGVALFGIRLYFVTLDHIATVRGEYLVVAKLWRDVRLPFDEIESVSIARQRHTRLPRIISWAALWASSDVDHLLVVVRTKTGQKYEMTGLPEHGTLSDWATRLQKRCENE